MLFSSVFSLQISLTLHRKSDDIYLYLSIEVLYEEKEIELDCLNNEIDTINPAFDLGFRLIEIITIADQYFKELLIYKKDKFDLITAILKSNNVKFHY